MADPEATDGGSDSKEEPTSQEGKQDKTFSQAELNRIVQDRLAKERGKYEGFDDYRKAADELAKLKESEKSETEKLQGKVGDLEKQLSDAQSSAQGLRVERVIYGAAVQAGAVDVGDVVALKDDSLLKYEDGVPTDKSVDKVIEDLKSRKPYLFGQSTPKPSADGGARSTPGKPVVDVTSIVAGIKERNPSMR